MAMTDYKTSNYDFHEQTLNDNQPSVKNTATRTVVHYELVLLNGYFGEVRQYEGIEPNARGRICIEHARTLHTSQVKAGLAEDAFVVDAVVFFVPQALLVEGYLCAVSEADAVPVGIITDADSLSAWVEFRPFSQSSDVSLMRDELVKIVEAV